MRSMQAVRGLTVGRVARLAGVTPRTLHHYDAIGLLVPSGRSPAGYRQYTDADIERLARILFYRELDLGLDEIARVLGDGGADALIHLRRQRAQLHDRIRRLTALADAVTRAMEAHTMKINLTPEERLEVFGSHDPDAHAEEVRERWGDTDAYAQSASRTARYEKADWERMKSEGATVTEQLAAALRAGLPADGATAMDAAEAHRRHIATWFYDCGYEMHTSLASMYLADPRFTATYEAVAPGLAQYVHDAIVANAARQQGPG